MRSWRTDPPGFAQALRVWRRNRCVGRGTIAVYRYWICRFGDYCGICKLDERQELTEQGAERFARWWRSTGSPRHGHLRSSILSSRSALRAWAFARIILGDALPTWRTVCEPPVPRALRAFAIYVSEVRGNPPRTIHAKLAHMAMFTAYCRRHRRPLHRPRLRDIDNFVMLCRRRYARKTVSAICSTLRSYLRFLRATGRSPDDLAGSVLSPIVRVCERPHRSLPWSDVQRILRAVDRSCRAHLYEQLSAYKLSHVYLMRQLADLSKTPIPALAGDGVIRHFRRRYHRTLILNVGIDRKHGAELPREGFGDLIAFGRDYIANPDLVERIRLDAPLNEQRPGQKAVTDPRRSATRITPSNHKQRKRPAAQAQSKCMLKKSSVGTLKFYGTRTRRRERRS